MIDFPSNPTVGQVYEYDGKSWTYNGVGWAGQGAVNVGPVSSVAVTAGTGINVTGSPITSSGTINVTNTAPDQVVALTASTGISTSGTYPNFTIGNTAPDQVVSLTGSGATTVTGTYPNFTIDSASGGSVTSVAATGGTGISITGSPITTSGTLNITNTAPDQIVALTGAGTTSISGTYPNFTITSADSTVGTVTSVSGTGTVSGISLSGTVTSSGNLTLGGSLDLSSPPTIGNTAPNTGRFTNLTVDDNTTLGGSNTDNVTFNARIASEFTPATDNAFDLGSNGREWRDLFIDGTANIDSLIADTADINGGTIDGTTIGATTASTGAFTSLAYTGTLTGGTGVVNLGSGQLFKGASGNVGIGTSSPALPLEVVGAIPARFTASSAVVSPTYGGVIIARTAKAVNDGTGIGFSLNNSSDALTEYAYIGALIETNTAGSQNGAILFAPVAGGSRTERMRIDSSGNLLVGTTSATSSSNTFLVNSAKQSLVLANGAVADSTVLLSCIKSGATSSTAQRYIGFSYNGGANGNGAIAGNGDSQATFITLSDARLKENITALPTQLDNVMALRPVEFDYKATGGHQIGFIAQEVQEVYPDLVAEGDDGYLTLAGFDKNTARLIKAIQELKAINDAQAQTIESLTARVVALEQA